MSYSKYPTTEMLDDLKTSILIRDCHEVGRIVHVLRFHFRMNYESCWQLAHQLTSIDQAEWDQLLYESDMDD